MYVAFAKKNINILTYNCTYSRVLFICIIFIISVKDKGHGTRLCLGRVSSNTMAT